LDSRLDENLVLASRAGDKKAYACLVKRYYKHIFIMCLGILGRVHDAEDIAQEVMLKGFVNIGKLRDASRFGAWIARIAKNLCADHIRRKRLARQITAKKQTAPSQAEAQSERLQRALEKLPREMRLPLVMYFFDGESVKTVAEKLNISRSGVYQKLRTAIEQLHDLLVRKETQND